MDENERRTGPEERERLVEVVIVDVDEDVLRLRPDLLVCAQNDH